MRQGRSEKKSKVSKSDKLESRAQDVLAKLQRLKSKSGNAKLDLEEKVTCVMLTKEKAPCSHGSTCGDKNSEGYYAALVCASSHGTPGRGTVSPFAHYLYTHHKKPLQDVLTKKAWTTFVNSCGEEDLKTGVATTKAKEEREEEPWVVDGTRCCGVTKTRTKELQCPHKFGCGINHKFRVTKKGVVELIPDDERKNGGGGKSSKSRSRSNAKASSSSSDDSSSDSDSEKVDKRSKSKLKELQAQLAAVQKELSRAKSSSKKKAMEVSSSESDDDRSD